MNTYRFPAHLLGLLFLIVAIADCSQGGQQDTAASSVGFGRSVLGTFQDWEAVVFRVDGVSVCHARTTSASHLVAGQPWSNPAELRVTGDRFDLKVADVGRKDGWEVTGADQLSGSELARHLEALEANRSDAAVDVSFRLDPQGDDSDVGAARFSLRGFSEAYATSRAHCADERASRPPQASRAPIRSLAESGITETYRWGSLGPDPHVELVLTSSLFGTRGSQDSVVIKMRMQWLSEEVWISQAEADEISERYGLARFFSRPDYFFDYLGLAGAGNYWEVYRNEQRMGAVRHLVTSGALAGVCSDPFSHDLRFFQLGWSGSASYPEELSMFYFTANDEVRDETLWTFEGADAALANFVDCNSAEAGPIPCPCDGPAAGQSSEYDAIVNEIWEPIRDGVPAYRDSWPSWLYGNLPPLSLEWTSVSEEVMRRRVLEPIHTYSGFRTDVRGRAPTHAELAMNSEFAVLFLNYGSDRLIFGGARAVFARRLSDTAWTLLYDQRDGGNDAMSSGGFVDSDRVRIIGPRGGNYVESDTINVRELLDWGRSFVASEGIAAADGAPRTGADGSPIGPGGMEFVWVEAGDLLMDRDGSDPGDGGRPGAEVLIRRGFWLGKYEVTQSEWESVMGTNPSRHADCGRCPVERVSWEEAQEFIRRVNSREDGDPYRLPTRAEWEYAARARMTWDEHAPALDSTAWHWGNSEGTHPVGGKAPNGWGLHDMVGNVAEWMADENGTPSRDELIDPMGRPPSPRRTYSGCGWRNPCDIPDVGTRFSYQRRNDVGFRLLRMP